MDNRIKMPAISTAAKVDPDIGAAYVNAVLEIPAKLEELVNMMDMLVSCLVILTDATRKKAISEGVFEIDEYKREMEQLAGDDDSDSDGEINDAGTPSSN